MGGFTAATMPMAGPLSGGAPAGGGFLPQLASIIGTVASSLGQMQQGNAQAQASLYNAQVAQNNATQARYAADVEAQKEGERTRRLLSTQKALLSKSGVDLEGSPLLVLEETAALGDVNQQFARYEGDVKAKGYEAQAELDRYQARMAKSSAATSAGTSLLRGFNRIYSP